MLHGQWVDLTTKAIAQVICECKTWHNQVNQATKSYLG